jgi:hypothetical protein
MSTPKKNRPGGGSGTVKDLGGSRTSLPLTALELTEDSALCLIVTDRNGRPRRRVVLSVSAAERAVRRAAEQGREAHVTLCRMTPIAGDRL